ncbi:hypothetical protein PENVUL_c019G00963 [Penicillium vulpinum]|uniref:Uncharacterized protein n=1 Tax=Penicillium vulpinum TaxID=29845 RepID=A0A1V6RXK4_9EURO|nr:hypothetical protein PENVUL_c019G00963 [Penicillium vulpinum]
MLEQAGQESGVARLCNRDKPLVPDAHIDDRDHQLVGARHGHVQPLVTRQEAQSSELRGARFGEYKNHHILLLALRAIHRHTTAVFHPLVGEALNDSFHLLLVGADQHHVGGTDATGPGMSSHTMP